MRVCACAHVCACAYALTHTHIYIKRERERERYTLAMDARIKKMLRDSYAKEEKIAEQELKLCLFFSVLFSFMFYFVSLGIRGKGRN